MVPIVRSLFVLCMVLGPTPAVCCVSQITPQISWRLIDESLPKVALSPNQAARVAELRKIVHALIEDQRKDGSRLVFDKERYGRAIQASREAMDIVGLVKTSNGTRCGEDYRLMGDPSKR